MPRRRIAIGEYGEIGYSTDSGGRIRARARTRDRDGVLREVTASGASRAAARRTLLADLATRHAHGTPTGAEGLSPTSTVGELATAWLEEVAGRNLSTSTTRIYADSVRLHIRPAMGQWLLREATTRRVDRVLKDHRARGLNSTALRKHLNQMFALAVRHDAMPANPVTNVAKVRHPRATKLSLHQAAQLSEIRLLVARWETTQRPGPHATDDMRVLVLLLMATGARIGEVLALRWCDIDLSAEHPSLRITGTIKQEKGLGVYRQDYPKSPTSERPLALPPSVVTTLKDRKESQEYNPIDAVFVSRVGTWFPYSNMRRRWQAITAGSDYEWVTFKAFRKGVGTVVARELGLGVAKDQLGHASQTTTEMHYLAELREAPPTATLLEQLIHDSAPDRTAETGNEDDDDDSGSDGDSPAADRRS